MTRVRITGTVREQMLTSSITRRMTQLPVTELLEGLWIIIIRRPTFTLLEPNLERSEAEAERNLESRERRQGDARKDPSVPNQPEGSSKAKRDL